MPNSPYILGFNDASSFSSVNSITIVAGVSWGSVSLPLTPLHFTRENLRGAYDIERYFPGHGRPNNQYCFDEIYLNQIFTNRVPFWGEPVIQINKRVHGVNLGIEAGGIFSAVEQIIETVSIAAIRRILTAVAGIGYDGLANTVSTDSTIYGCNGIDTCNIAPSTFSSTRTNVCYIQAGAGCLVGAALSIMILGDFSPVSTYLAPDELTVLTGGPGLASTVGLARYLADVYNNMKGFCFIGDASAGLILPGASVALIAS